MSFEPLLPWMSRVVGLVIVVILVGLMPDIAGIDPSQSILRARSGAQQLLTAEALQAVRDDLGLDRSASERLLDWLYSAMQGDLGRSWIDNSPVGEGLFKAATTSLTLMGSALLLALLFCSISVVYTIYQWRRQSLTKQHNSLSTVMVALPEYVIASLAILIFSVELGWFPPYGWQSAQHLWLPSLALAVPASGLFSRLLNDNLKRVFAEPWVITWLSARVSTWHIGRFALYRAVSSLVPQLAMIIIGLTGGAVAVEVIFSIPGLGRLLLGAVKAQDLPVLQGGLLVLLLFSMAVSITSLVIERAIVGNALQSGKLISTNSSFNFTQSKLKRAVSFGLLGLMAGCAIWAMVRDPFTTQFMRLESPSLAAPFGSDAIGRDLLARVGRGMFLTLQSGIFATALCLVLGIVMGFFSRFTQGFIEITKALPYLIAGLLVAGLTGMHPDSALIAIVLTSWAPLASHCASLLREAKGQPFTHLAPVWGTQRWTLLRHYTLPYVLPPLLRHAVLRLPVITLSLTSLSFIGLGVKPPESEWGLLIAENLPYIERAPQAVLLPILGLVMLGIAVNLLFDD